MSKPDIKNIDQCDECFFYAEHPSGKHGFCKFEPPQYTNWQDGHARFHNPVVAPTNYCSKFIEAEME